MTCSRLLHDVRMILHEGREIKDCTPFVDYVPPDDSDDGTYDPATFDTTTCLAENGNFLYTPAGFETSYTVVLGEYVDIDFDDFQDEASLQGGDTTGIKTIFHHPQGIKAGLFGPTGEGR